MDNRGASSPGREVCTQEKSIITPTNGGGGGGDFKPKTGGKEKKTRERKMTHAVQSRISLMETINNVTLPALLCLQRVAVLSILDVGRN